MTASGERLDTPLRGFAIPDTRFSWANLDSSSIYTEAGPRPGSGVCDSEWSQLRVAASGAQDETLTVTVTVGGMPALEGGLRAGYTPLNGTDRGWSPPSWFAHWTALVFGATAYTLWGAALVPDTHDVALLYSDASGVYYGRSVHSSWATVTSASSITSTPTSASIAILPRGRRIVYADRKVYYSDDGGIPWSAVGTEVLGSNTPAGTILRTRLLVRGDELVLFVFTSTPAVYQYVSTNGGATFRQILAWTSSPSGYGDVAISPSGELVLVLYDAGTTKLYAYRVGSPQQPINDATAVEVNATAALYPDVALAYDFDGMLWCFARAADGNVYLDGSYDDGDSWTRSTYGVHNPGDSATYMRSLHAVAAGGQIVLAHQFTAAPGTFDDSVCVARLGGWGELSGKATGIDLDLTRIGHGPHATDTVGSCLPFDKPSDVSFWTAAGAGTDTVDATGKAIKIVTVANTRTFTRTPGAGDTQLEIHATCEVTSGGSLATNDVAARLQTSNGATAYGVDIRVTTTQLAVFDAASGAQIGSTFTITNAPVEIRAYMRSAGNSATIYVRNLGSGPQAPWASISGSLTSAASATRHIQFGVAANATTTAFWRVYSTRATSTTTVLPFTQGLNHGRPLLAHPYPIDRQTDDGDVVWLRATYGPGYTAETHTIEPVYDYGLERLFCDISPSPSETWRSDNTAADVELVWYPADGLLTRIDNAIVVAFLNCNFRYATFQGYDGTGWVTLGEYDAGLGEVQGYFAQGTADDALVPDISSTAASRYIQRGELGPVKGKPGATMYIDGGNAVEIEHHSEGVWAGTDDTQAKVAEVRAGQNVIDGATVLVPRNGLLFIHDVASAYTAFKILIPAQTVPIGQDYFEAGNILICRCQPIGRQWALGGRSAETQPQVQTTRDRRGVVRRRELAAAPTTMTVAWADDLVDFAHIRETADLDWLSTDGLFPLANVEDVHTLLRGILQELRSGELPTILLCDIPFTDDEIPDGYATLTDRTLFLYGSWASSVDVTFPQGDEGDDEVVRVGPVTIEGIE